MHREVAPIVSPSQNNSAMAPPDNEAAASTVNTSPEYKEFMEKLAAYHEKRGTRLDPEPKIQSTVIDLLKLFQLVVSWGGYDKVSEEKKLWRQVIQEFIPGTANLPGNSFLAKTVYYKNLAAYEISTIYGKEPPPKEILEDLTARGYGILNRTLENYKPSRVAADNNSDASGDDGTPAREHNDGEETPGSGGRATRGLRQAPPQRILFQPDTQSSRQSRHVSATSHATHASSPQHSIHHPSHQQSRGASSSNTTNIESTSVAFNQYEPRPHPSLTLRPVVTPGNNVVEFARRQRAKEALSAAANGQRIPSVNKGGVMLPGSGFDGPNIYVRCLMSLKSGIPSEQKYALHHLVKISMERGDKYRFESFAGLAEALINKLLEVGSLFYCVSWEVSYMGDHINSINILDGAYGTPDILQRISKLTKLDVDDNIQSEEFSDLLLQVNEAALTMRNMVMLEENAQYVSDMSPLRDFLSIALNLPNRDCLVEMKHYSLEIAEQITKYLHFEPTDPLYISLLAQLQSDDRGVILTTLRALCRISMNLDENNLLKGVPAAAVQNISDWTIVNDEDLIHASLDFLYQYTAVVDNVDFLIANVSVDCLVTQLTRLLSHGVLVRDMIFHNTIEVIKEEAPHNIAPIPRELFEQLLTLDEPARSSQWLRCLFEEDRDEFITQIALWTAYQNQFASVAQAGHPILAAAEFIKNVQGTFADRAAPQVVPGVPPKFVIKGIRMRRVAVDFQGDTCKKCQWNVRNRYHVSSCGKYFISPESMFRHILLDHLHAPLRSDGKFDNSTVGKYVCHWDGCSRFHSEPIAKLMPLALHIKLHLSSSHSKQNSDSNDSRGPPPSKKLKPSYIKPSTTQAFKYWQTAVDEQNQAAGIPLTAVLVLRNLARNLSKTDAEDIVLKTPGGVSWVDRVFKPVEPKLYEVMAHNANLKYYMAEVLGSIKESS